jgi:hypothetical protein
VCVRVLKDELEANLTEHFSRQIFNFSRNGELFPQSASRVRETSPNGPRILPFGFRREWSVFRERYFEFVLKEEDVDILFFRLFLTTSLKKTILTSFRLVF